MATIRPYNSESSLIFGVKLLKVILEDLDFALQGSLTFKIKPLLTSGDAIWASRLSSIFEIKFLPVNSFEQKFLIGLFKLELKILVETHWSSGVLTILRFLPVNSDCPNWVSEEFSLKLNSLEGKVNPTLALLFVAS